MDFTETDVRGHRKAHATIGSSQSVQNNDSQIITRRLGKKGSHIH